jgi:anaerobic selenocysteine-containing dehydrogenase
MILRVEERAMSETRFRTCNLCEAMCGLAISVEGGQITKIQGDREDVFSRGYICPKGAALRELHEDPDRLRQPLRRTSSGWERIGWDEALSEVADQLHAVERAHGRDAVAMYTGNPAGHNHGALLMSQVFATVLGSKNRFDSNSQDANPRLLSTLLMLGDMTALTVPDVDRTEYFLILGANPVASGGSVMSLGDVRGRLEGIVARGGRVVLVDPRRTETAKLATEHHFIRPGGDPALLLALLEVIFGEGLFDEAAARRSATGLDELRELAARFPPERVSEAIGMSASTIRTIARDFARAKSAVAYGRVGICLGEFGPIGSWLIEALNVVTGNFDRPGGSMFPSPAVDLGWLARALDVGHFDRFRSRVRGLPELGGMLPASAMAEEMETPGPGQIRALVTLAGNPVLSVPGGERLSRALAGLDFMVSIDIYLNETTRHARLILPPRSTLERGHYDVLFHALAVRNTAKWSEPVLPPEEGSRDEWSILYELAVKLLGLRGGAIGDRLSRWLLSFGPLGSERVIDALLRVGPRGDRFVPFHPGLNLAKLREATHGVDLGPLVPSRERRVRTADGRVDLAPPILLADVSRVDEWLDAGRGSELRLIGRRHLRSNNSWMHNLPSLVKGPDRSTLLVHPDDAARLGLARGSEAEVESVKASVRVKVEISDAMMPGVVSLPHGFGHGDAAETMRVAGALPGVNMNLLMDERGLEPVTGTAILSGVAVKVRAVIGEQTSAG